MTTDQLTLPVPVSVPTTPVPPPVADLARLAVTVQVLLSHARELDQHVGAAHSASENADDLWWEVSRFAAATTDTAENGDTAVEFDAKAFVSALREVLPASLRPQLDLAPLVYTDPALGTAWLGDLLGEIRRMSQVAETVAAIVHHGSDHADRLTGALSAARALVDAASEEQAVAR